MHDDVVHIISERTSATHPHSINHFLCIDGAVRSSARISPRADPFLLYAADLLELVRRHQLTPHACADDVQIYGSCRPTEAGPLITQLSACVYKVSSWMASNRLQVNPSKTEVLWCSSSRRQHQIPSFPLTVDTTSVSPVASVGDLAVYLDADLTFRTHVNAVVKACFAVLRQMRSIRRCLRRHTLTTLIHSLVIIKVDYCSSLLAGVSSQLLSRLQFVFNAAARMIYSSRRSEHITPLLRELHWLKVPQRIQFRLCVLRYQCLHGTAPAYLSESLHSVANIGARRCLHSADTSTLLFPSTRRSTVGDQAFPVAVARAWNALPVTVRGASTLSAFCRQLKTHLYCCTFD